MPFTFENTPLPGVIKITPRVFQDNRGFFFEDYKRSEFYAAGIEADFVQGNHSHSTKGVVRGLHYQLNPMAQGKLVSVVRGDIYDVAVDIRVGSPTFGHWYGCQLTETGREMLYIPTGFAHGFAAVSDVVEVCYKVTAEYSPENEAGIIWNDPEIGIDWQVHQAILSEKDLALPALADAMNNFTYSP